MRILFDTNILIPLEDSSRELSESLSQILKLSNGKHVLLFHPESLNDLSRDKNEQRRIITSGRLEKYIELKAPPEFKDNEETELFGVPKNQNDRSDNLILFSLFRDCVQWLVTEDHGMHRKADQLGLADRVLKIEEVLDALLQLEEKTINYYPAVEDLWCHELDLSDEIFDSLRAAYDGFETWFKEKCCRAGRKAFVNRNSSTIHGLAIYKEENDPILTEDKKAVPGKLLKIATFKVSRQGNRIGELLLKQVFDYAISNRFENIFVTVNETNLQMLTKFLLDFGFTRFGQDKGNPQDAVYLKQIPIYAPESDLSPAKYGTTYFPCFKVTDQNYLIPIKPDFHKKLFPELEDQQSVFGSLPAGNSIKKAYLCHAQTSKIKPGCLVFFYRSQDEKKITSYGFVERFQVENDAEETFKWVSKRSVYTFEQIKEMTKNGKKVKIVLFRIIGHFHEDSVSVQWLKESGIIAGNIQSITCISKELALKIIKKGAVDERLVSH